MNKSKKVSEFVKGYETSSLTLGCTAFCYDEKYLFAVIKSIEV